MGLRFTVASPFFSYDGKRYVHGIIQHVQEVAELKVDSYYNVHYAGN